MHVHSVDSRRKRNNYCRYARKEAMYVKVIAIARGAREKILRKIPDILRLGGRVFHQKTPRFLQGGEYPQNYFQ